MNFVRTIEIQNNHNWILGRAIFIWSSVIGEAMVFPKSVHVNIFSLQNQFWNHMWQLESILLWIFGKGWVLKFFIGIWGWVKKQLAFLTKAKNFHLSGVLSVLVK